MADQRRTVGDFLKSLPLYPLPHHLLSRMMHAATRIENTAIKNWQINTIRNAYNVDLSEATLQNLDDFKSFNQFFTRELREEARPVDTDPDTIVSPVDAHVSQAADIRNGRIIQAKGHDYSVLELLGGVKSRATPFNNGRFTTLYLSPRDYHRIHMPLSGTLREMVYIPGRLFSVGNHTVKTVPRLFARNERVVCIFDTDIGPVAHVLVGAIFVASIETVWAGEITPPNGSYIRNTHYPKSGEGSVFIERAVEMGRFNMGSTTITLFPENTIEFLPEMVPGAPVRLGQRIATKIKS